MDKLETQSIRVGDFGNEATKNSNKNSSADTMSDKDNCLFSIANILKGSSENARHFIQSDGPRKVMQELLRLIREPTISNEKMEIIELCVSSIKQLANTKQTFKEFLEFSPLNRIDRYLNLKIWLFNLISHLPTTVYKIYSFTSIIIDVAP